MLQVLCMLSGAGPSGSLEDEAGRAVILSESAAVEVKLNAPNVLLQE